MQAYQNLDNRLATLALWYIVNTSLTSFYKLTANFTDSKCALIQPQQAWQELGIHKSHQKRWQDVDDTLAFLERVYHDWQRGAYGVLFVEDEHYPSQLTQIYDPSPVLFYRGDVQRLSDKQIAIVGSRNPSTHAQKTTFDIAQYLAHAGFTITSGLAQGVDRLAHLGALSYQDDKGKTVGVMGVGIDLCYPRNHHALYAQIVNEGGCLVTELLPGTPASKHTFPKRNRLVAGLSLATVVTEAAMQSGSLITARLCAEQGKQVFAVPSLIDNSNAEGCHHLIREGATLIYHPKQILEDVGYMHITADVPKTLIQDTFCKSMNIQDSPNPTLALYDISIPEHLLAIFEQLDEQPKDLDSLVLATNLPTGELLAKLMELELLGLVVTVGGMYKTV